MLDFSICLHPNIRKDKNCSLCVFLEEGRKSKNPVKLDYLSLTFLGIHIHVISIWMYAQISVTVTNSQCESLATNILCLSLPNVCMTRI